MPKKHIFFAVLLVVFMCAPMASARTWFVERDGSGEFANIQNAVNACSPGDTIMIGPGRYDDFHPLLAPAWNTAAIVNVTKDNLTFIGSGTTSTIVGPVTLYDPPELFPQPSAIAALPAVHTTFRDLGVENAAAGFNWSYGTLDIEGCRIDQCDHGLLLFENVTATVRNTEFLLGVLGKGIISWSLETVDAINCTFAGPYVSEKGIYLSGASMARIENCHFACGVGVVFFNATGSVSGCTTTDQVIAPVWVMDGSSAQVNGNQLHGSFTSLDVQAWSTVTGANNVFTGGGAFRGTIRISSWSTVQLNNNIILKDGPLAVSTEYYSHGYYPQDLTGNYWGTTNADSVAAWIFDSNDDPAEHAVVNFLPMAGSLVPTEGKSWGDVKSMFR